MTEYCDILEVGHSIEKPNKKDFKDYTDHTFGRWTVLEYRGSKDWSRLWLCICSCESKTLKIIKNININESRSKSCGCYKSERSKEVHTTHGLSKTVEWKTWDSIIQRCNNSKSKDYPRYGGRGITVCGRWLNSFENFYKDMGPKPINSNLRFSIERIDNNSGYYPKNCIWGNDKEQSNNRRNNRNIEYNGEIKTLSQWANLYNIAPRRVSKRIKSGWTIHEALTIKNGEKNERIEVYRIKIEYNDKVYTIDEFVVLTGIKRRTIQDRFYRGMTGEEIINTPIKITKRWNK